MSEAEERLAVTNYRVNMLTRQIHGRVASVGEQIAYHVRRV